MANWIGRISDVKGAFLKGDLDQDKEQIYMHVPKGFEEFYGSDELLQLLKAIYGMKQAAMDFWRELIKCMKDILCKRSGADPCLYFKWMVAGIVVHTGPWNLEKTLHLITLSLLRRCPLGWTGDRY